MALPARVVIAIRLRDRLFQKRASSNRRDQLRNHLIINPQNYTVSVSPYFSPATWLILFSHSALLSLRETIKLPFYERRHITSSVLS